MNYRCFSSASRLEAVAMQSKCALINRGDAKSAETDQL